MPYRPQYAIIDAAGEVLGVEDYGGDHNWIDDPQHPEAAQEGAHQGYVAKPNINLLQETTSLAECNSEQEAIRLVLRRLDPNLIISPSLID